MLVRMFCQKMYMYSRRLKILVKSICVSLSTNFLSNFHGRAQLKEQYYHKVQRTFPQRDVSAIIRQIRISVRWLPNRRETSSSGTQGTEIRLNGDSAGPMHCACTLHRNIRGWTSWPGSFVGAVSTRPKTVVRMRGMDAMVGIRLQMIWLYKKKYKKENNNPPNYNLPLISIPHLLSVAFGVFVSGAEDIFVSKEVFWLFLIIERKHVR